MTDTIDPKHLDKRTAERYIRGGQLDEKTWEQHLKDLPDVTEKFAIVETRMSDDDAFDDEGSSAEDDEEDDDEGDEADAEGAAGDALATSSSSTNAPAEGGTPE